MFGNFIDRAVNSLRNLRKFRRSEQKLGLYLLSFCLSLTLALQPVLLISHSVNAASPAPMSADDSDRAIDRAQELYEAGNYPQAIELLTSAIAIYRRQGNLLKQAIASSNLALVYQQAGNLEAAERAIAESLKLLENRAISGRPSLLAQVLDVRGQLQFSQGQTQPALATWERTERLYSQLGDYGGVTRSRLNQCHALRVMGFYRRAQTILETLQPTLAQQPDSAIKLTALRSLGIALAQSGDLNRAEVVLVQSLNIAQKLKLTREISSNELILGNLARDRQKLALAIAYYDRASASVDNSISLQADLNRLSLEVETAKGRSVDRAIAQIERKLSNLPANRFKANAQINFAESLAKLNRQPIAARILADVIEQSRKFQDDRTQSLAFGTLGELYKQRKQWSDAESATNRALNLVANAGAEDLAYRWYSQLGFVLAQQQKDKQALDAYSAAISTLKLLRKDLVDVNRDVQFTFKESIEPTYRELVALLLKPSNRDGAGTNLARARDLIEDLQVAELDNFFREACINNNKVIIDEVVDRENPNAAIIYPIILPNELQVIAKIPGQKILKQYRVAKGKDEVEKVIYNLQDILLEPDRDRKIKELSQQINSWLVEPFEKDFNGKIDTLVFVLDGAFRNIPMAVLYDGRQYLIEKKYAIATSLGLRLQSPQPISKSTLRVLAAGLAKPSPKFAGKFSELPAVPSQLKAILDAGIEVTKLQDDRFTIQAFGEKVKEAPYNVLHMATHGQFSSQIDRTFLLANDGELKLTEFDRLLRDRAQVQRSPIELLVMSACETAVGDSRATLGLAGVAVKAGAQSTLASLWKVKDDSTAVLMGEFYRELKTGKISKAEALRRAQIKLLKEKSNYTAPLYWAPFILVGNWL